LAAALWRFWDLKGHLIEGRRRLERALRADERPTARRAEALSGAADMALTSGDVASGERWAIQASELHRELGDSWGTAFSLLMVAYAVGEREDWGRACDLYDESARLFAAVGDEHYALRATRSLAWAYYESGDVERAREVAEGNLRHARATGDEYIQGVTLSQLADYATEQGRLDDAVSLLEQSHRILRHVGDPLWGPAVVCRLARVLAQAGRAATAARVLAGPAAVLEESGAMPPWLARINDETLGVVRMQLDEAAFTDAWEQGQTLTVDEAVALALDSIDGVALRPEQFAEREKRPIP
jgi:predicted negative regulator of RcsB-dependent stress response